jgi:Spy/CpxP family protein refolding chaperone
MKRWIKRTLFAIFGFVFVAGGLAACAHRERGEHFGQASAEDVAKWRGKLLERAGKELALDESQKQRLGVLFDKMDEQRRALVASGAAPATDPRAAMRGLISGDRFDRERATALVAEKTDAVRAKSPEVIAAAADFFDTLRPEQQAKVREFLDKRHHGRG